MRKQITEKSVHLLLEDIVTSICFLIAFLSMIKFCFRTEAAFRCGFSLNIIIEGPGTYYKLLNMVPQFGHI